MKLVLEDFHRGEGQQFVVEDHGLHLMSIDVYSRTEDAGVGRHTRVDVATGMVTQDGDMSGNISSRRTSVALHFLREDDSVTEEGNATGVEASFSMNVVQHKGTEYVVFRAPGNTGRL